MGAELLWAFVYEVSNNGPSYRGTPGHLVRKAPLMNISINTLVLEEDATVIKKKKKNHHTNMTIDFVFRKFLFIQGLKVRTEILY